MGRKNIFVIVLLAFIIIISARDVFACPCTPIKSDANGNFPTQAQEVKKAFDESNAIFSGVVTKIVNARHGNYTNRFVITFRIDKSWKGITKRKIKIFTGLGGGDCGYPFKIGKRYLVYAYDEGDNELGTNICAKTTRLTKTTEDLKILDKLKTSKVESNYLPN